MNTTITTNIKNNKHIKTIREYLTIVLGVALTAAGISIFYVPNKIVSGGVSGISTILYHQLSISPSVSFAVINVALLIIGLKCLGKKFIIRTLLCSMLLSLFVEILGNIPPVTNNIFLATVFGAILYGSGIALTLVNDASTGGTDILSRLIQYAFKNAPIGKILLIVDALVIVSSLILFKNVDLALFGIIALYLSTGIVDLMISKLNISKLVFVITDSGDEIADLLISTSPRGVTKINVTGAYSAKEKMMLVCALKESEMLPFQQKILSIDPTAFIIFAESQQILGEGFHIYR